MKLVSDALCNIDDVKSHYEMVSNSNTDDVLAELINTYTKLFCNECGRTSFKTATYTEYYDGNGDSILYTKHKPIISVTTLADDTDYEFGATTIFSSSNYRVIYENTAIQLIDDIFTQDIQNIKLVYSAGYSEIPKDLKNGCIKEVGRAFKHKQDWDVVSNTISSSQSTYIPPGLSEETLRMLSYYKTN